MTTEVNGRSMYKAAFTQTRVLYGYPVYEFRQTRVCMYFNGGHSHTYEYGLPINFTCTSSFCAGRVFIQLVES